MLNPTNEATKLVSETMSTDYKIMPLTYKDGASYTLAKAIDNSSAFNDLVNFQNHRLSRGLSDTDVHHNFVMSYIWAIPFDRAFGGLPKRLTEGWQLQGITRFATGFPIQMQQSGEDITGAIAGRGAGGMVVLDDQFRRMG